jgi:hypothetical protein
VAGTWGAAPLPVFSMSTVGAAPVCRRARPQFARAAGGDSQRVVYHRESFFTLVLGFRVTLQPRLAQNLQSSQLCLLGAGITGMPHHTQLIRVRFWQERLSPGETGLGT